ncbi:MAG: hypothetical protein OXF41_15060 [bacterium]|nr:hypothetical protein [bacterium]
MSAGEGTAIAPGQATGPPAGADQRPAIGIEEQLGVYAFVGMLRELVNLRRNEPAAANAALYGEVHIRKLCAAFRDPIDTLRFVGNHLLINLHADVETKATIAVGPRGTLYMRTRNRRTLSHLPASHDPVGQWTLVHDLEGDIRPLGLPAREQDMSGETASGTAISKTPTLPQTNPYPAFGPHQTADPPPPSEDRPPITSLLELADDPAVNRRPHQYAPEDDPPKDLDEKTLIYSPVMDLRDLADRASSQEAASATWHAETYIRRLCATFTDPIKDIRIDDNCVVITVKFPDESEAYAKIAVGPRGTTHAKIGNRSGYSDTACKGSSYSLQSSLANMIESELRALGLPTPQGAKPHPSQNPRPDPFVASPEQVADIRRGWAKDPLVTEITIDAGARPVIRRVGALGGTSRTKIKADRLTVTVIPRDPTTTVDIHPADTDPTTPGHQINTPAGEDTAITITATTQNGTSTTHTFIAQRRQQTEHS